MRRLLKVNAFFLYPFFLWLIFGLSFHFFFDKGDLVLYFNDHQSFLLNTIFYWGTKLGEGTFVSICLIIMLFRNYGNTFILGVNLLVCSIFVQVLKRILDFPRPPALFEFLCLLPDVDVHLSHSFPSGHATVAFVIFTSFAIMTKYKLVKVLFFVIAMFVAISRIYLMQHFYMDVIAGSFLGVTIAFKIHSIINKRKPFNYQSWKNKNLIKSINS